MSSLPLIILLGLTLFWVMLIAALLLWKRDLFLNTWNEAYLAQPCLLIESDDWGPGGTFHAERLHELTATLNRYTDSVGRPAVLTADMVLAVPDFQAMARNGFNHYERRSLKDGFPELTDAFHAAMATGSFVPQLHGLEHQHGEGLARLARERDTRIQSAVADTDFWDWEQLDSPLQAHYVDGTQLPSTPHPLEEQKNLTQTAFQLFEDTFGFKSLSTVAPCYLWVDDTETAWSEQGARYIQTAGYRCPGRRADGSYIQDIREIRPGYRSSADQIYLVRNAMYEPVDGRKADTCIQEIEQAFGQALPATISTHRYNYTRSEAEHHDSLEGLAQILESVTQHPGLRFLSSPELGQWLDKGGKLENPADCTSWPELHAMQGFAKFAPFLKRLRMRHAKLNLIYWATLLFIPLGLLSVMSRGSRP